MLLNDEIISKLKYIHLFLMNIINIFDLPVKNFYTYMELRALYKMIQNEINNKLLNNVYSEINKLKNIFIDSNKKEEALKNYKIFYENLRSDYKISNYSALRIFIVDYFTYELKKYSENKELFPIIMDVLSEDNGAAFMVSNKISNIFLKKYIFKTPPKNEEECENILENAYKIKKEINEDLFLKKYNEIINTKGNEKIKEMIDEIVQQVFGFYFNGYFMSYLDSIYNTNNYKDLDYTKIFDNNKLFFIQRKRNKYIFSKCIYSIIFICFY